MSRRCLVSPGALALVVVSLSAVPLAQAPTAAVDRSRTPWGEPDLQGIWAVTANIPLERPDEYAEREFLTDEEVAELDRKKSQDIGRNTRGTPGSEQDVTGAYNAVFNSILRTSKRTSLIIDPSDGKVPPLTTAAQKRVEMVQAYRAAPATAPNPGIYRRRGLNRNAEGPEDLDQNDRCLGSTLPDLGGGSFADGTVIRIVQSPGYVAVYHETNHGGGANRIIPTDGSPHDPLHVRRWLGDARGRWEGSTLVIDTTNFTHKTDFRGSHENLHLIERYTRVDTNTLQREVTIDDPTTWTRTWTVLVELGKMDEKQNLIFESSCHEGNFGLTGILSGARAEETKAQTPRPE